MKTFSAKLGEHATLTAYLHEPSAEMKNMTAFPGILVFPGGGFRFCSDREAEPVAMAYFAEGYQAFVLDYTTVTKKPNATIDDPMLDAEESIRWIRTHAKEYHLADHQLALIGFSGGGHLAAAIATHGPERPDALILGYPGIVHSDKRALECPDIVESVDKNTPPTFIFGTRNDPVVPPIHPMTFAMALLKAGVDYELHLFKDGVHGLSLATALTSSGLCANVNPVFAAWFQMSVRWLKEQFGEFTIFGINDGKNGRFSIDNPLETIFANEAAKQIILKFMPIFRQTDVYEKVKSMNLRTIAGFIPGLNPDILDLIDKALQALG